jgi:heterodisulfide reductase subunit A
VIVLYRDIRTFGFKELSYKEAREQGVIFIRYDRDTAPEAVEDDGSLKISFIEPALNRRVNISPDRLVLSAALRPHSMSSQIAGVFKLPRDDQGFLLEAHIKLRPLDFPTDGIFLGTAPNSRRKP